MRKIKILRIITRLNIGGPAIHTTLLTKELNDSEFESVLLHGAVSKGEGDMEYVTKFCNISSIHVPRLKRKINPFNDIIAFCRIFKYIRQYKPDIVHTHTAKAGFIGRLAAFFAGVPVKVHTFHGHVFHGYFNRFATRFFIFIERILAKFTDSIIAISQRQREEIVENYRIINPERCCVIRLGFDLGKFLNLEQGKQRLFRERFNFKQNDILVGMVGRLTSIKNHKMFIDVIDYVNKTAAGDIIDKIKFIIVGDGEMKDELLAYSRFKRSAENIFFTGWFKEIDKVYADLDIVALTSINEGTPVSLIEAMVSSKPVISTNVGGVKDAVGEAGILVKAGDYKTMGDKILELASSPEKRQSLGKLGREFVRGRYSKERLVSELKELYRNLTRRAING
ncbi:MAG: glycosyltransferase family 4 protein [Candidatus Omnitrophota bacterium]|nr:MAG: glycosyltransferase family 4 protein [Candidatus Omnitrophota bacterium]